MEKLNTRLRSTRMKTVAKMIEINNRTIIALKYTGQEIVRFFFAYPLNCHERAQGEQEKEDQNDPYLMIDEIRDEKIAQQYAGKHKKCESKQRPLRDLISQVCHSFGRLLINE
jgi:hypothetical protein